MNEVKCVVEKSSDKLVFPIEADTIRNLYYSCKGEEPQGKIDVLLCDVVDLMNMAYECGKEQGKIG